MHRYFVPDCPRAIYKLNTCQYMKSIIVGGMESLERCCLVKFSARFQSEFHDFLTVFRGQCHRVCLGNCPR
ncbi:hypothetical protein A0H81_00539 [Grifola frondosa]|uniref:Uncharacterized protein n=1 Tax=Grifola frondosa TaxID=5627 RepID=A0A1C7MQ96_GRIFR|nr:hypothetical protein A0H81_00539 [Grifola frondosa]